MFDDEAAFFSGVLIVLLFFLSGFYIGGVVDSSYKEDHYSIKTYEYCQPHGGISHRDEHGVHCKDGHHHTH